MTLRRKVTFGLFGLLGLFFVGSLAWGIISGNLFGRADVNDDYNKGNHADIRVEIPDSIATKDQLRRIWQGEESDEIERIREKVRSKADEIIYEWAKPRYSHGQSLTPTPTPSDEGGGSSATPTPEEENLIPGDNPPGGDSPANPYGKDFILVYTKGGKPLRFDAELAGGTPTPVPPQEGFVPKAIAQSGGQDEPCPSKTNGTANFKLCPKFIQTTKAGQDEQGRRHIIKSLPWRDNEKKKIFETFVRVYPEIVKVDGQPLVEMTGQRGTPKLKLIKWDDPFGGWSGYYDTSSNELALQYQTVLDIMAGRDIGTETFVHELIHAFRDDYYLSANLEDDVFWEEGVTEAAGQIVVEDYLHLKDRISIEREYDRWNVPYIVAPFRSDYTIGEGNRYEVAAAAFEKLYYQTIDRQFFITLNQKAKQTQAYSIAAFKSYATAALKKSNGNDLIEGLSFNNWYGQQFIFKFANQIDDGHHFFTILSSHFLTRSKTKDFCFTWKDKRVIERPVTDGRLHLALYDKENLIMGRNLDLSNGRDETIHNYRGNQGCFDLGLTDYIQGRGLAEPRIVAVYFLPNGQEIKLGNFHFLEKEGGFYGPIDQGRENSQVEVLNVRRNELYARVPANAGNYDIPMAPDLDTFKITYTYEKGQFENYRVAGPQGAEAYFKTDTYVPQIQNDQVKPIDSTTAKMTWDTDDEPAAAFIQYGESELDKIQFLDNITKDKEVDLSGLQVGKKYNYRITAIDRAGNYAHKYGNFEMKSPDYSVTDLKVENITDYSAKISWKTLDKNNNPVDTYGSVVYGPLKNTDEIDPGEEGTAQSLGFGAEHQVQLINLSPFTTYGYKVKAKIDDQTEFESKLDRFLTEHLKMEIDTGEITDENVEFIGRAYHSDDTPAMTTLDVIIERQSDDLLYKVSDQTATFEHRFKTSQNIVSGDYYIYHGLFKPTYSKSSDKTGEKSFRVAMFQITDVQISTDYTEATISWETKYKGQPKETTGKVSYGEDKNNLNQSVESNSFKSAHSVKIAGLKRGTLYYGRIIATTRINNEARNGISFMTKGDEYKVELKGTSTGKNWIYIQGALAKPKPVIFTVKISGRNFQYENEVYHSLNYEYEAPPILAEVPYSAEFYYVSVRGEYEEMWWYNGWEHRWASNSRQVRTLDPTVTSANPPSGTTFTCFWVPPGEHNYYGYWAVDYMAKFSWDAGLKQPPTYSSINEVNGTGWSGTGWVKESTSTSATYHTKAYARWYYAGCSDHDRLDMALYVVSNYHLIEQSFKLKYPK